MKKFIFFLTITIIFSCKKQASFTPQYNVPAEFQKYITTFQTEASSRGKNIIIDNLIIQYDSSLTPNYCAKSNVVSSVNNVQKIISINAQLKCWSNSVQLETLIFHELGHCVLGRNHNVTTLHNGAPKSIMYPNDITIYSPCVYAIGDSCNKFSRRKYYLDELFNPSTPAPDWAK